MAESQESKPPRARPRRAPAWHSTDVLRTAALVLAMYVAARLFWFASPLLLTAFIGVLFGLAVSSGADRLARVGVHHGIAAGLIVFAFFAVLMLFGAILAPTLREQAIELRGQLPEAVGRVRAWIDAHQAGYLGQLIGGIDDVRPG